MRKRDKIIIFSSVGALVVGGVALALILGLNSKKKSNLYDLGVKYLVDAEYQKAAEIFGDRSLKNYKDTPKKYNYSIDLQRYEQHYYTYENLIDYGLSEKDSVAVVDFDTLGGEAIARKKIDKKQEGKYISEVAVKTHYDFISWRLTYACYEQSSDAIRYVLEANYSERKYEINCDLDGGTTASEVPSYYYYNRDDVSIPNAVKEGYTFLGYQNNLYEDVRKDVVIPKGTAKDISLTAKYEALTYNVTLNANGGTVDPDHVDGVTFGADVSNLFPTPIKANNKFDYWTYQGNPVDLTNWSIAANVELLAHYTPIQYRISYILHNAENPGLPETCSYYDEIKLPYVEKENSIFIGWKKVGSGSDEKPDYIISQVNSDIQIEAIFVDAVIDGNGKLNSIDIADKTVNNYVIPSFVNDISADLFYQNESLINIFVDSRNTHFSTELNNKLLVKDGNIAFAYPILASQYTSSIHLPTSITEIGENCFRNNLFTSIDGSDLVTKINARAFYNSSLEECNLSNINYVGNSAFENSHINQTFLDDNVETLAHIGDYAFKNTEISAINITNTVQHIGTGAFSYLHGFNTISFFPNKNASFGENIFDGCGDVKTLNTDSALFNSLMEGTFTHLALENIVLSGNANVANNICENNTTLKTVDLSSSTINQINSDAFKGDTSLTTVTLPSSLKRIKSGAFEGCSNLYDVNFDDLDALFSIEEGAFKGTDLNTVDFSKNPHLTIEDHAFTSCLSLTNITMVHGQIVSRMVDVFDLCGRISHVTYIIPKTDEAVVVPNYLFENLNNVEYITFVYQGNSQIQISLGNFAFKNCASLIDIEMNNCYVTEVPYHCFEGCKAFTNTDGNFDYCVRYNDGAFIGCVNLDHMLFDEYLTYIGAEAFAGCYSLCNAYSILNIFRNEDLIIGLDAFADITGVIYLDFTQDEVNALRADKWYGFDEGFSGEIQYKI